VARQTRLEPGRELEEHVHQQASNRSKGGPEPATCGSVDATEAGGGNL